MSFACVPNTGCPEIRQHHHQFQHRLSNKSILNIFHGGNEQTQFSNFLNEIDNSLLTTTTTNTFSSSKSDNDNGKFCLSNLILAPVFLTAVFN